MDMFPAFDGPKELDARQITLLQPCSQIGVPFPAERNKAHGNWWHSQMVAINRRWGVTLRDEERDYWLDFLAHRSLDNNLARRFKEANKSQHS